MITIARKGVLFALCLIPFRSGRGDTTPLTLLDPNLQVTTYVGSNLSQPIGIVFLGPNDALVLEKASGQVKRVINGVVQPTPVLDLAVNSNSERGLLSLALHPNFPATPFVYIRWTESSTGADSAVVSEVALLGNRVDRFIWNGSTLTFDRNLIMLRSRQTDNVAVPGIRARPTRRAGQSQWRRVEVRARTGSFICSWATRAAAAGCRTCRTARS